MSNEVQPKVNNTITRKGHVNMSIKRTIQTSRYHSLVMSCQVDEEIQWTSLDDWFQKQRNWESILIRRYKEMHDNILKELNMSEKQAYFNDSSENKVNKVNVEKGLSQLDNLKTLE